MFIPFPLQIFYRPQTRFGKVMFSQVSVCPQGGVSAPLHAGIQTPRQAQSPWHTHPPGDTAPRQVHPLGRYTHGQIHPLDRYIPSVVTLPRQVPSPWAGTPPRQTHNPPPLPSACCDTPPVQCMLGYSQQAGSIYPTGMHSCF